MTKQVIFLSEGTKVSGPTSWKNSLIDNLRKIDIQVADINSNSPMNIAEAPKILKSNAVHAYHVGGLSVPFMMLAKVFGKHVVYTVHGDIYKEVEDKKGAKRVLWLPLHSVALSVADSITFPSSYVKDALLAKRPDLERKSKVVFNGIDLGQLTTNRGINRSISLLTITNFKYADKARGVDILIDSVTKLREKFPGIHLTILGGGPLLESYRGKYRLPYVSFKGFQPIGEYLKSARIFVHSSFLDIQPYVILEAVAAGLPVVATDVGGISEMLDPLSLVEPNEEYLSSKLSEVISDDNLQRHITNQNQKLLQKFNWNNLVHEFAEIY